MTPDRAAISHYVPFPADQGHVRLADKSSGSRAEGYGNLTLHTKSTGSTLTFTNVHDCRSTPFHIRWALLQQGDCGLADAARRTLIRLGELWGLEVWIEIFLLLPHVRCHVLQDFVQLACHGRDNSTCVPKSHSVL